MSVNLTAIFIDGGYVDKCAKSKTNYVLLSKTLAQEERVLQTYYYNGYPYDPTKIPNFDEKHLDFYKKRIAFFRGLETLPKFTCRYGYTVLRDDIFIQKGVDSLIVVDMLMLAARKNISSIRLLTGDRDFIPGIKAVRDFGVIVHLFTFKKGTYANVLQGECDSHTFLNEDCKIKV